MTPTHIIISGASGLIGTALRTSLETDDIHVTTLVRRPPRNNNEITWDPGHSPLDPDALAGADAVVNLNGASIGKLPWTAKYRETLRTSRLDPTRTLATALRQLGPDAPMLVSASATGIYGNRPGETLTETSPPRRRIPRPTLRRLGKRSTHSRPRRKGRPATHRLPPAPRGSTQTPDPAHPPRHQRPTGRRPADLALVLPGRRSSRHPPHHRQPHHRTRQPHRTHPSKRTGHRPPPRHTPAPPLPAARPQMGPTPSHRPRSRHLPPPGGRDDHPGGTHPDRLPVHRPDRTPGHRHRPPAVSAPGCHQVRSAWAKNSRS